MAGWACWWAVGGEPVVGHVLERKEARPERGLGQERSGLRRFGIL